MFAQTVMLAIAMPAMCRLSLLNPRAVAGGPAVQGLGFSKRSDREVDGFGEDAPEAQPETIAVHSAFGAPPAEDNDEDSMW